MHSSGLSIDVAAHRRSASPGIWSEEEHEIVETGIVLPS
jgi:hypothetical protein